MGEAIHWTNETPTDPGYYWHRDKHVMEHVVHIGNFPGYPLEVTRIGYEKSTELRDDGGEWFGPIHPPR